MSAESWGLLLPRGNGVQEAELLTADEDDTAPHRTDAVLRASHELVLCAAQSA